jgi:cell division protein FtsW
LRTKNNLDLGLFFACVFLILFGLMMISSVSVYESFQLTSLFVKKGISGYTEASNDFYLWRHFWHVIIALPVMYMFSKIPYQFYKKIALPSFVLSLVLLVLVLIPELSNDYGSAKSWLNLPFLPSIQPSEIAKLSLIFYLSLWMDKKINAITSLKEGFLPFLVLLFVLVLLIGLQPDFGAVLVITFIAGTIFFVAGGNLFHIFAGVFVATLSAWPVVLSHHYIKIRLLSFLDPSVDPQGAGYQIKQALLTIGSGKLFGVGFGKSVQKFGYLPEVQGDTIFSVAAEELGFIRITFIILIFLFIAIKGYTISLKTNDRFAKLLATGISSWIFFQAMINVGVNMAVLPLTGITLPFISYGGTSLLTMAISAGILLNISRYAEKNTSIGVQWGRVRRPHNAINRYF